jgi:hypothetical protein
MITVFLNDDGAWAHAGMSVAFQFGGGRADTVVSMTLEVSRLMEQACDACEHLQVNHRHEAWAAASYDLLVRDGIIVRDSWDEHSPIGLQITE